MSIVFKLSENLIEEVIEHYKETSVENKPPYTVFQSKDFGTVVTLYESGKIMFQGVSADIDYSLWRDREMYLNHRDIDAELARKDAEKEKKKEDLKNSKYKYAGTIGSDEVGTGDYFGPIVVTASYVSLENIKYMESLGVKDSKKITDTTILEIAPKLMAKVPYVSYTMRPYEYNNFSTTNMNKIKAILHNKVLYDLVNKDTYDYKYIVVDQFTPRYNYFAHIKEIQNKVTKIDFTPKAEDQCYSVAASSIISRYIFLKEMDNMTSKYKMEFPKGAGQKVDEFGVNFIKKYNTAELVNTAKLNFKNTDKIKELLK